MEKRKTGIKNIAPYAYITPITLILVTFVIGSVIISVVLGFTKYNIMTEPVFSGLDNYKRLLTDSKFIKALKNTLELIVIIVPLETVSGILVSSFLVANRKKVLGKLANCIVFIPVLCADAVAGVVWREFLNGKLPVVEHFFGLFGIEPSMLLGDAKKALIVAHSPPPCYRYNANGGYTWRPYYACSLSPTNKPRTGEEYPYLYMYMGYDPSRYTV